MQLDRVEQALSYAREKKGALLRTLYKRARSENSCPVGVVTFVSHTSLLLFSCAKILLKNWFVVHIGFIYWLWSPVEARKELRGVDQRKETGTFRKKKIRVRQNIPCRVNGSPWHHVISVVQDLHHRATSGEGFCCHSPMPRCAGFLRRHGYGFSTFTDSADSSDLNGFPSSMDSANSSS
jgi:hypothetical protein